MTKSIIFIIILLAMAGGMLWYRNTGQFPLPQGEPMPLNEQAESGKFPEESVAEAPQKNEGAPAANRPIFVTNDTKHSIPLNEILSGGPGKDGIPSIDNPKFVSTAEADGFLKNDDVGLSIAYNGETKFYPYQILVWHEIVNDSFNGKPALVTYCPLCATGIAFDPVVNSARYEFGVSGKLWQSNLLMYNRTSNPDTESLWSQVLGEAVLGPLTGTKLHIIPSDTVQYGEWKRQHPQTSVLSRDTGAARSYGADPYGDYYTSESVSFGASFNDTRLHPKAFVLGIEVNGQYKAYHKDVLPTGVTADAFAGRQITIVKGEIGEVRMFISPAKEPLPYIGGFWFSWLAVHPTTELFK